MVACVSFLDFIELLCSIGSAVSFFDVVYFLGLACLWHGVHHGHVDASAQMRGLFRAMGCEGQARGSFSRFLVFSLLCEFPSGGGLFGQCMIFQLCSCYISCVLIVHCCLTLASSSSPPRGNIG